MSNLKELLGKKIEIFLGLRWKFSKAWESGVLIAPQCTVGSHADERIAS